jgi:hypothetical protein
MVTAGADPYARNSDGLAVSEAACYSRNEGIWMEALAECGIDPRAVFSIEDLYAESQTIPGTGVFLAVPPLIPFLSVAKMKGPNGLL